MSAEEDEEEIIIPEETVNLFAVSVLGINLDTEQDLLYVAEDALYDKALKENGWQVHIEPAQKLAYFYNENSQESVWVHPEAEKWKKRLQKQRAKLQKEKDQQKEKDLQKEQGGINSASNDTRNLKQQNDKGSNKGWKAAGVTGGNSSSTEPIVVSNVPNNKADQAKTSSKPADPNDEVILIEEFEDFGSDNLDKKANASESSSRLGDSSGNGALATEKTKKSVSFGMLSTSADFLDGPSSGSGNSGNSSNTVDNKKDKEPNSVHPNSLKQSANTDASNYINNSGSKSNAADTTSLMKDSAKGSSSSNSSNRNASSSVPIAAEKENKRVAGVETDRPSSLSGRISASSTNNITTTTTSTTSSSLDDISGAKSDSWSWKSKETVQSQQDINRSASPTRAAAGQPGPVNYSNAVPYQDMISLDRHKLMMMEGESKLKAQVTGLEVELKTYKDLVDSERQKRLDSDEKSREKINELEVKLQSIEMDNDVKNKVMVKKLKLEADEEFEYKLKTTENRFNEEIEGLKTDTLSLRKKNEELMREADVLKRKADLIREETKVEQAVEIETMKREQALHVEREAKLLADLKKMKDEHISLVTKLTVTSQALQVTQAEKDAIESASMHSKHESASNHSALVMATQRINELEGDNGKLRAENSLLSRASEAARLDRQKEASQSSYAEEKAEQLHREIAKIKAAAQAEQGKLSSRVIELETIQNALRKQVQTEAEAHELEARELKRASARLETECDRYKEKNHELDIRSNNDQIRITQMEKEVFILKERVHDRDKQLKDEEIRYSLMRDSIADIRREIEKDSVKLRQDLDNEIRAHKESKARHIGDLDAMKLDVAERIPKLTALAVEGVEAKMVVKMRAEAGAEIARVTAKYTEIIDELRQELDAMKMTSSNKERKMLAAHAHELDMLQDKHKSDIARLKGDNKELELKLESSRLSSVHSTPRLTYQDDFNAHVHNLSNLSYSDRSGVSPSFSFNPVRNNNSSSNNNNISYNTADRRSASLSSFNSSFNPNFRGHGQAPPMPPHMLPQQQQNQQNQQSFTHPESASFDHAGAGLSTIIDSSSISNQNTSQIIGNQGGLGSINEAYFAQLMQAQLDNMMKVLSQNKPSHDIIGDGGRGGYSHSTFTPTKKAVDGKRQQFQQQRGDGYSNRSNQNNNSRGADQEDLSIFNSPAREDYYSSRNFDDMNNNNNKMYDNRGGNRGGDMSGLSRVRFERSLDGYNYGQTDDRNYQQQWQQQQQGRYQSGAPDHTTSNSFTNSSARPNQSFNSHNNSNNNNHNNNHNNGNNSNNNNNNNNGIDRDAADEDYLVEDGGYHDGYWKAKYAKESIM